MRGGDLGADGVVLGVHQRADLSHAAADLVHAGVVLDVDVDESRDERPGQLPAADHQLFKAHALHLLLEVLQVREHSVGVVVEF